jgi:hypothetical protein
MRATCPAPLILLDLITLTIFCEERSKVYTIYDRLNIEIAGSNPARGMNVCLCVSVLCCPVFR